MVGLRAFLESSTIHGMSYISAPGRYVRVFWTLVVIAGFTGAGIMIHQSFQSWADSPVKTTIETLPITKITFPKVTVCPPKNTYTDLNYDLMMIENMTLSNDTRDELTNYSTELLHEQLTGTILTNLDKMEDDDRYFNWYNGITKIEAPYYSDNRLKFYINTYAQSGSISSQYFGEQFDAEKVETDLYYSIKIRIPKTINAQDLLTLHVQIDKISMKDLSKGTDKITAAYKSLSEDTTHFVKNYTNLKYGDGDIWIKHERRVSKDDVLEMNMDQMPGFKISWRFTGNIEKKINYFGGETGGELNRWFVRNWFYLNIQKFTFQRLITFLLKTRPKYTIGVKGSNHSAS